MKKMVLGFIFVLSFSFVLASEVLVLGNESMPFNGIENGKNVGICVDILEEITKHGGPKFEFKLGLPWLRAQNMLHTSDQTNIAIIPFTRTPQREDSHMWIVDLVGYEFRLSASDINRLPRTMKEATTRKVGIIAGSANIPSLLKMGFNRLEEAPSIKNNILKLISGRIDVMAESSWVDNYAWAKAGKDPDDFQVGLKVGETKHIFLAGNLNFDPTIAEEIRTAYNKMVENGKLEEVYDRWR